ncbi:MAG: hypothetical protein HZC40_08395 [Chloroflexi bacterium]|nr:hypothetical protein [Chloroflexota bacterium]
MNLTSLWSVLESSFDPLNDDAFAVFQKIADEQGFEPGWITWLAAIFIFGAEPFSVAGYMRVFPYGSARVHAARLASAVQQEILTTSSNDEYRATEKGKRLVNRMMLAAESSIAYLQPIAPAELQRILDYGERLVAAALSAPEPPSKFGATHYNKNMRPRADASPMRFFVHYFATLDKYRGNAHLATWHQYNIEGNRWEVLTYVWKGEFNTLEKLRAELNFRGITREEYGAILQELAGRGWIEETSGEYRLTAEGKQIREDAEALTNRYFFASWSCLSQVELEDFFNLAVQLRDGLRSLKK